MQYEGLDGKAIEVNAVWYDITLKRSNAVNGGEASIEGNQKMVGSVGSSDRQGEWAAEDL